MKRYLRSARELAKATWNNWNAHHDQMLGAALAYYTVLSIAPLLLLTVAVVGLVLSRDAAQHQIIAQFQSLVGTPGASVLQSAIHSGASKPKTGTLASIIGFAILLYGAAGVFNALRDALNMIWEVKPKSTGLLAGIRDEFLSFGFVLGLGFLLLVSLLLSAAIAAMGTFVGGLLPIPEAVMHLANFVVTFIVVTVLFAAIYRIMPATTIPWEDVWIGGAITSLLFSAGKLAIGIYLGKASVGSAYGAAGSIIVLLVWIYYSAQIFFFGAEFTHAFALKHGSRSSEAPQPETPVRQEVTAPPRPRPEGARGWMGLAYVAMIAALGALLKRRSNAS